MSKKVEKKHYQTFENLKHTTDDGMEFWSSRQLAKVLDYAEYRNFQPVIEKAKKACENSGQPVQNHFVEMHEMVDIGSGAKREMPSVGLSRYACYLIVQNADPSKPIIANGQTYFAIQTHYEVGSKVRQTIKELGGTMPEDLPSPQKGIRQVERDQKKLEKK
jgi:DNA-damage-inducible protein D